MLSDMEEILPQNKYMKSDVRNTIFFTTIGYRDAIKFVDKCYNPNRFREVIRFVDNLNDADREKIVPKIKENALI